MQIRSHCFFLQSRASERWISCCTTKSSEPNTSFLYMWAQLHQTPVSKLLFICCQHVSVWWQESHSSISNVVYVKRIVGMYLFQFSSNTRVDSHMIYHWWVGLAVALGEQNILRNYMQSLIYEYGWESLSHNRHFYPVSVRIGNACNCEVEKMFTNV